MSVFLHTPQHCHGSLQIDPGSGACLVMLIRGCHAQGEAAHVCWWEQGGELHKTFSHCIQLRLLLY